MAFKVDPTMFTNAANAYKPSTTNFDSDSMRDFGDAIKGIWSGYSTNTITQNQQQDGILNRQGKYDEEGNPPVTTFSLIA